MNSFTIISCIALFGLTIICFLLPFYSDRKQIGKIVGLILTVIITLTLIGNIEFLVIFIWPLIGIFQILFIAYWTCRKFGKNKAGAIIFAVLTIGFILLLLQPWIADWTYSKNDVRKVLSYHKIDLKDKFDVLKNESGGFSDYYETFTIRISDNDFIQISHDIKTSPYYKGYFNDYSNLPGLNFNENETIEFETDNFLEREYFSDKKMNNGTYHFHFQLDKKTKELSYTGSDE